jgi:tetratricopeptide (TPR) repeat protein
MALTGDLGMVASQLGDYADARAQFEVVLAQARAQGSRDSVALQLVRLGDLARLEGDYERAAPMYEESLALCQEIGDVLDIAASLFKLGQVARRQSDLKRARKLLAESLSLQQEQGNQQGIIECVAGLAGLAVDTGQLEAAARLFGAAEALLHRLGAPLAPADQRAWERDIGQLQDGLAPEILIRAWAAGHMSAEAGAGAVAAHTLATLPTSAAATGGRRSESGSANE